MRKKTSGKSTTDKGKARRKLTDLGPKRVKRGDANAVKGGVQWGVGRGKPTT